MLLKISVKIHQASLICARDGRHFQVCDFIGLSKSHGAGTGWQGAEPTVAEWAPGHTLIPLFDTSTLA